MPVDLTESQIKALLEERKVLPEDFQKRIHRRLVRLQHERAEVEFKSQNGNRFRIMVRQNKLNPFDFSAILGCNDSPENPDQTPLFGGGNGAG